MPSFSEKGLGLDANVDSHWLAKLVCNIYSYWTSVNHYESIITSLQLFVVTRMVISLIEGDPEAEPKNWFLGLAVILILSDIKLTWLKREILSVDNSGAFRKLSELEQSIQFFKEELYGADQDKDKDELEEENQDDCYFEDFLGNDDEEQDNEG
jgi:hypothetical protein